MNSITSLYIPHVQKNIGAQFIADLFSNNHLAQVSMVYIEPCKSNHIYNRVYVLIDFWHDTEAAYSFIKRLQNTTVEARIVYSDDDWWVVYINQKPSKFATNNRVLTVFQKQKKHSHDQTTGDVELKHRLTDTHDNDNDNDNQADSHSTQVNVEKSQLIKNIIGLSKKQELQYEQELQPDPYADNLKPFLDWVESGYMFGAKDDGICV